MTQPFTNNVLRFEQEHPEYRFHRLVPRPSSKHKPSHPVETWNHLGVTVMTCDACGWIKILSSPERPITGISPRHERLESARGVCKSREYTASRVTHFQERPLTPDGRFVAVPRR